MLAFVRCGEEDAGVISIKPTTPRIIIAFTIMAVWNTGLKVSLQLYVRLPYSDSYMYILGAS